MSITVNPGCETVGGEPAVPVTTRIETSMGIGSVEVLGSPQQVRELLDAALKVGAHVPFATPYGTAAFVHPTTVTKLVISEPSRRLRIGEIADELGERLAELRRVIATGGRS